MAFVFFKENTVSSQHISFIHFAVTIDLPFSLRIALSLNNSTKVEKKVHNIDPISFFMANNLFVFECLECSV